MIDRDFTIKGINKRYEFIFDRTQTELIGKDLEEIIGDRLSFEFLKERFLDQMSIEVEREFKLKSNESKYFLIKGIPIYNKDVFNGGYLTFIDITSLKIKEEKIRFISEHDVMTGLYNRRYFQEKIDKLFKAQKKNLSVIMADLNNLKDINDTFGHSRGDRYIQLAAKVIEESIPEEGIIARIGGDEFGMIIEKSDQYLCQLIGEIINRLSKTYTTNHNLEQPLSIAYGFAVGDDYVKDAESLCHLADGDMYRRKKEMKSH